MNIGTKVKVAYIDYLTGRVAGRYVGTISKITNSSITATFKVTRPESCVHEKEIFNKKTLYGIGQSEGLKIYDIFDDEPKEKKSKSDKTNNKKETKMATKKTTKRAKPEKRIQVAKKLGLKPMPKGATISDWKARVAELQAKIKSGKYQGHLLRRCHTYINGANYQIRKLQGIKASKFNANQAMLPNFTKQLDVVRIEEMVAERLFTQLRAELGLLKKKAKRKAA